MTVHGLPTRPVEPYVTRRELARMMGVSESSVKRLEAAGMPRVTWGLRTVRYLPSVAIGWAKAHNGADANQTRRIA